MKMNMSIECCSKILHGGRRNSKASSVAIGFSTHTLTDGNCLGFIERKASTFFSNMELNPWIHNDLDMNTRYPGLLDEIYMVRVFMAESECNTTLSMDKVKLRKCKISRDVDISVPNIHLELLDTRNTRVASRAFSQFLDQLIYGCCKEALEGSLHQIFHLSVFHSPRRREETSASGCRG